MTDALTGLNSRHELHIELAAYAARADSAHPLTLLLLKIRDWDLWRHHVTPLATDRLLQVTGTVLQKVAPADAFLARWSDCVFGLLLPNCPQWCGEDIGEALRVEAQQAVLPAILSCQGLGLDLVYGCGTIPPEEVNLLGLAAEEMLAQAEGGVFRSLLPRSPWENLDSMAVEAYIRLAESFLAHGYPYLRRHGMMTAAYCQKVGQALEFSQNQLAELNLAAAFGDLCMAEAAGSALDKPGCLTYGEFRRMARHPVFAADLCRTLKMSRGVVDTVLYHHEALDGSGYPEALQGEEIPLSASLLGCCGAFAAMQLPRPYRPARPLDEAKNVLIRLADVRWPAKVVQALLDVV